MGARGPVGSGVRSGARSISVRFFYAGKRLCEPFAGPPTATNVRAAEHYAALIRGQIEHGTFTWRDHFPGSKHAAFYEANPCKAAASVRVPRRHRTTGIVYVVQQEKTGAIKIGYTADRKRLSGRIAALTVGSPYALSLLTTFEGTTAVERKLHEALSAHRLNGEWFAVNRPDLVDYIKRIADA